MNWLIERGIGETRALLLDGEEVLAAKLFWPGELTAGSIVTAKLSAKPSGSRRGLAVTANGTEILLDKLLPEITEGTEISVAIQRAALAERGRFKRALGRVTDNQAITASPLEGRELPAGKHLGAHWDDIWHAASAGQIDFAGGSILVSTTPAMTVIDIDGQGSPRDLAHAAIPAIAQAIRWFDLGGNIGIDFPTIEAKKDRKAVDEALERALAEWPHERTSMNGFGFVQIVAKLEGPSLLHRFATSRTGMCARLALRVAERVEGPGITLLTVHPALKAKLKPEWLDELRRRTGRELRIETDPALALEAPHAQLVQP